MRRGHLPARAGTRKSVVVPETSAASAASASPTTRIHLFVCYYQSSSPERNAELDEVMRHVTHHQSAEYDEVHVVIEQPDVEAFRTVARRPATGTVAENVRVHVFHTRARFCDLFALAQQARDAHMQRASPPRRVVSIVCNSDVYVGSASLRHVRSDERLTDSAVYALTRYDVDAIGPEHEAGARFFRSAASQDCWIFGGALPAAPTASGVGAPQDAQIGDYLMGVWGCDNRLVYELAAYADCEVRNPSLTLRTYHLHNAGGTPARKGYRPQRGTILFPYLMLTPTTLREDDTSRTVWTLLTFVPTERDAPAAKVVIELVQPTGTRLRASLQQLHQPVYHKVTIVNSRRSEATHS